MHDLVYGTYASVKILGHNFWKNEMGLTYYQLYLLPRRAEANSCGNRFRNNVTNYKEFRLLQLKLQIRRHSMQELPETADGIGQWCKDVFVTKV